MERERRIWVERQLQKAVESESDARDSWDNVIAQQVADVETAIRHRATLVVPIQIVQINEEHP